MTESDERLARKRYEGLYRAVARRNLVIVGVCVVATIVVAGAFVVFVLPAAAPLIPPETSPVIGYAVLTALFFLGITVLPSLAQLIFSGRAWLSAVEALNAWALTENARWRHATGTGPPILWTRGRARRWLSRHPGAGGAGRIRILVWTGELNAAAEITAHLPVTSAFQRFERRLFQALIEFVATGRGDLEDARAQLELIDDPPGRDQALLALAIEEARLAHAAGDDWLLPLAAARDQVVSIPKGASIRDRFVGSLPGSIGLFVVIAGAAWVLRA